MIGSSFEMAQNQSARLVQLLRCGHLKNGKERKITIKNFTYVPNLTEYLFSITYDLKNDFHFMDKDKTIVLYKNKIKIKFDRVVNKG